MSSSCCRVCGGTTSTCDALAPLPFAQCEQCGFVQRIETEVHELYEAGDYGETWEQLYCGQEGDRRRDAQVRLRWLSRARPGKDLLDVGAAAGEFVAEALDAGYRARGIEPSPAVAARARELHGLDVRDGTLEQAALGDGTLDVVTMWHVLEHIPQPVEELRRITTALRPGGVVAIEVPNYGSAVARRMGSAWTSLQPDVHVSQFAPATLALALRRAGLEAEAVQTLPITPYLSARERIGPRHLAGRLKAALWLRSTRTIHPHGHELLRAIGRRGTSG